MTYENFVQVQLAAPLGSSDTTLTLANPTGAYRLPPATGGILVLADSVGSPAFTEIVSYVSRSGNTLSGLTRGHEGTSARAWPAGTFCYQSLTSGQFVAELEAKAPLDSPGFTGNPTAPTPAATDNDTSIATTAFVRAAMGLFGLGTNVMPPRNDLNALTTAGMYQFSVPTSGLPGFNYGMVLVLARASTEVVQIAWDVTAETQVSRKLIGGTWSPWRAAYHTGNILGTVSQAGGVPTGAIIERGSNANGEYVRFADGTQICSGVSNMTTDTAYGSTGLYYTLTPALTTFPANFANTSYRVATAATSTNILPGGAVPVSGSTFRITGMYPANAAQISVHWIAIGRWY